MVEKANVFDQFSDEEEKDEVETNVFDQFENEEKDEVETNVFDQFSDEEENVVTSTATPTFIPPKEGFTYEKFKKFP